VHTVGSQIALFFDPGLRITLVPIVRESTEVFHFAHNLSAIYCGLASILGDGSLQRTRDLDRICMNGHGSESTNESVRSTERDSERVFNLEPRVLGPAHRLRRVRAGATTGGTQTTLSSQSAGERATDDSPMDAILGR